VKSIKKMPQSFHARYDAKGKIYKYFIANKRPSVFQNNYIYYHPQKLDMRLLKTTAKLFVGTHNFLSFTTSKLPNTTRTINDIKIAKDNQQTVITVKGNGFLRYMVRMLVGAMLDVSNHNKTTNDIRELLIHPKKGASITKAKACGLYLVKVCY
jgi:tRNA pseudouridine38-40 synthase